MPQIRNFIVGSVVIDSRSLEGASRSWGRDFGMSCFCYWFHRSEQLLYNSGCAEKTGLFQEEVPLLGRLVLQDSLEGLDILVLLHNDMLPDFEVDISGGQD